MNEPPVAVRAIAGEPGWTPTAFVAAVEYVDPDGNPGTAVITSDGCTDARRERMIAALAASPRVSPLGPAGSFDSSMIEL